tara:strand:+ start:1829 stop:2668 length:840 start_codon:yes stop_codon:yes gene_type:complete
MKILITGINGQVGLALMKQLSENDLIGLTRKECNLTKQDQIEKVIDYHQPDLIINAAAYTKVDLAEDDPEIAFKINSDAPKCMAKKAREYKIPFIHFSTDYVFDGKKEGVYYENDETNPLGVYGLSKLAGERAIQNIGGQIYIFRTSWVYSKVGQNFFLTIERLIRKQKELRIVSDQFGVPTSSNFIANQIKKIIFKLAPNNAGIYHLVPDGKCSWYEFAKEIIKNKNSTFDVNKIVPIHSDQYFTKAKRPKNSVLDNSHIKISFMLRFDDWKTELLKL